MPTAHVVVHDPHGRGPGWARNHGLAQVQTPFVTFLDADDWIEPTFAETMLAAFDAMQGRFYLYSDWRYEGGQIERAPDCAWVNGTNHVVTTLIPTAWAREIGGFDEGMPGGEDVDFYLKLAARGHCGRRVPVPLFVYGKLGARSKAWRASGGEVDAQVRWTQTYGGQIMGCCGSEVAPSVKVDGRQAGDVLARPTWYGHRKVISSLTGRNYGRIDGNNLVWIDPRDVYKGFKVVDQTEPAPVQTAIPAQSVQMNDDLARLGMAMGLLPPARQPAPVAPAQAAPVDQRVGRLLGKIERPARARDGETVFFVKPERAYPSYNDFWKLVRLAGYPIIPASDVHLDNAALTYVFATPERWPDVRGAEARCIAWEFEYAGDYTHDVSAWQGELWASDPSWAKEHGARFVLLGSDPLLVEPVAPQPDDVEMTFGYDVTMLGYMVGRRSAIKAQLPDLRWTADYAEDPISRHTMLTYTRLMLHVHQHEGTQYSAPLRIALAAAYKLPVISETVTAPGSYHKRIWYADYADLPALVREKVNDPQALARRGATLYDWLCVKRPFAANVREALAAQEVNRASA